LRPSESKGDGREDTEPVFLFGESSAEVDEADEREEGFGVFEGGREEETGGFEEGARDEARDRIDFCKSTKNCADEADTAGDDDEEEDTDEETRAERGTGREDAGGIIVGSDGFVTDEDENGGRAAEEEVAGGGKKIRSDGRILEDGFAEGALDENEGAEEEENDDVDDSGKGGPNFARSVVERGEGGRSGC